jgi:hypothetical protein
MNKMCGGIESLLKVFGSHASSGRGLKFEALFSFHMNLFLLTHGENKLVL